MKTILDTGRYVVQEGTRDEFGKDRFALDVRVPSIIGTKPAVLANIGWYASYSRACEAMTRHRVNGV